jgi:glycosyltransferase involved in cell wall biosynthesis
VVHTAMKVGIYDRYWSTGGGGEKFAAGIAVALAGEHDVALVAHHDVDVGWLGERLQLDLSGMAVDVQPCDAGTVSQASSGYDLFVNASYRSGDPSRARHGLYVVHFPGPAPGWVERTHTRLAGRLSRIPDGAAMVTFGEGFYLPERAPMHTVRWTSGEATLTITAPARSSGNVPVVVWLGRFIPREVGPVDVDIDVDTRVVARARLTAPGFRADPRRSVALAFDVEMAAGTSRTVTLRSPCWVPHARGIGPDMRDLGVPVIGAHAGGGWRRTLALAAPTLMAGHNDLHFLDTYDRILSNSAYTQRWVRRLWDRDSDVVHPPVTLMPRGEKQPIILSVGRFFLPGAGHSKKQLELVEAFRKLCERGSHGWTFHLAGGCPPEHAAYLEQIRIAAHGLPVVLHPDATGAELRELYGRASIFWHAAGLDENIERHPDRYEHFGITTVEAMSAGTVPVVIDAAGQVEIVEQGFSGYRFGSLDGLVAHTERLIADPRWWATLSRAAERRAKAFGWDAFVTRVGHEVAGLG